MVQHHLRNVKVVSGVTRLQGGGVRTDDVIARDADVGGVGVGVRSALGAEALVENVVL